ncbi:arylsulfatase A-like enzyme [Haloferula luteola]|uniref:Arylsulfatase A-like enzyme n=1 Tax=Haloferula luteola TaxID=595692 RepID=A0A840VD03_9BACT|nr:arylsulfatase [Haloferula luteola]MBB5352508.1 arylsulfatase A-like enzyme [Haloferula luteola]
MKPVISALLAGLGLMSVQAQTTLFSDTFDRADSRNIDLSLLGITDGTGSSMPVDGVYGHGFVDPANLTSGPDGVAANGGGARIANGQLELATGAGTSNAYVRHNFVDSSILEAGGMEVSLQITSVSQSTEGQGGGFAMGMSEAQAEDTGDAFDGGGSSTGLNKMTDGLGNSANTVAVSDFWVVLRANGTLAWGGVGNQAAFGTASVGSKVGTISARFEFDSFEQDETVAYQVFFDGTLMGEGSFSWDESAENFIGLDARDAAAVGMDQFQITTLGAPPITASLEANPLVIPADATAEPVTLTWSGENLPTGTSYEILASPAAVFPSGGQSGSAEAGSGAVEVQVDGTQGDTDFTLRFLLDGEELATATRTVRKHRTNVLLILLDDMGFSDFGCYGSEIHTPVIDSLAATGLRYRNFYNTARCSTTRCALLSGLYTQQVGDPPGASLPPLREDNNVTIAELLSTTGYRRYMAGKWHTGTGDTRSPIARGWEHIFGHRSGGNDPHNRVSGSNHDSFWKASNFGFYSKDGEIAEIDYSNSTFHQTDAIGDYALKFLDHHRAKEDGAPFFLYLPFNAQHWPINAPAEMADRYTNAGDSTPDSLTVDGGVDGGDYYDYEVGWDQTRADRLARQKALGIFDPAVELSPRSPAINSDGTDNPDPSIIVDIPAWNSLGSDRQTDLARRMAVYAAMLEQIDRNIGRVVEHLDELGVLDDTLIFLLADNGGNYEGGLFGRTQGTINAEPVTGTSSLAGMGQAATPDLRLGGGWANVNNTPFRLYKHYQHEGGIRTPCIIHWPNGITSPGRWVKDRGHLIDIMATISEVTETPWPVTWPGRTLLPWEGESLVPHFQPETVAQFPVRPLGFEHESNRAWFKGNYKFVTKHFSYPDGSSPQNEYELYDVSVDPVELHNLAGEQPARVAEMIDEWNAWAVHVGVPSDRLILPPVPQLDPAEMEEDLFVDTFNRPDSSDPDSEALGMTGSLVPGLGAGSAYYDSWEEGSTEVLGMNLLMANGTGMTEVALRHNFVDAEILAAGGFSVELRVDEISSGNADEANRYAGIALGLSEAEAQSSNDVSQAGPPTSFRGLSGGAVGTADAFVELDQNGNVKCWVAGQLVETVAVGATRGTLLVSCETSAFEAGGSATLRAYFDGQPVDLDSATAGMGRSFSWSQTGQNYLGLSARATGHVTLDNLAVRLHPLSRVLAALYAREAGLSGAASGPGADPDGDGDDNFVEWLKAGNPDGSDVGTKLLSVMPSADGVFRFSYARISDADESGLSYSFRYSEDLSGESWTLFEPETISAEPLGDRHEVRLAAVPGELAAGRERLFIVVEVK